MAEVEDLGDDDGEVEEVVEVREVEVVVLGEGADIANELRRVYIVSAAYSHLRRDSKQGIDRDSCPSITPSHPTPSKLIQCLE